MGINIAIDGPAGAGKSTIARSLAKQLSFIYVDTGAMYRAMAYFMLTHGVGEDEIQQIARMSSQPDISIRYENGEQNVFLDGRNVSRYLRTDQSSCVVFPSNLSLNFLIFAAYLLVKTTPRITIPNAMPRPKLPMPS